MIPAHRLSSLSKWLQDAVIMATYQKTIFVRLSCVNEPVSFLALFGIRHFPVGHLTVPGAFLLPPGEPLNIISITIDL